MANNLVKLLVGLGSVVGKAFTKALRQEINASQQAAKARAAASGRTVNNKSAAADSISGISLQEAKQILNIDDITNVEKLEKSYDHLFQVNDKSKGGSFYIQSKVVRAKERIDDELRLQEEQDMKKKESEQKDT